MPKNVKLQSQNKKEKYAIVHRLQIMMVKRTAMGKRLRFFFTMFSTSGDSGGARFKVVCI